MDVQYNDRMYSYSTLWSALHADNVINDTYANVEIWIGESPYQIVKEREAHQIMSDLVKNGNEDYTEGALGDIFLGDYYADTVIFDGRTYLFDYESINNPTYTNNAERAIEALIQEINTKIGSCCEIQDDY
jgi:hypothetical protein